MAWVAGVDVTTGDLITAAQWNNFLGTNGSLNYLQAWTQYDVTGARAIDGTVYRNLKDNLMIVTVTAQETGAGDFFIRADTDINAAPVTPVATFFAADIAGANLGHGSITFGVVPNNYYKVSNAQAALVYWFEWSGA